MFVVRACVQYELIEALFLVGFLPCSDLEIVSHFVGGGGGRGLGTGCWNFQMSLL